MEEAPSNVGSGDAMQDICFSRNFIKIEKNKNNSTTNKNRNSFPMKNSLTKDTSIGKQITANGPKAT